MPRAPQAGVLCAHIWLEARHFFTRDSAQQFCWLWLLGADGRVHALRIPATRAGDDHFARSLHARFRMEPDLPIPASRAFGPALPLPAAPIVPLPRWHVSWGHPVQQALRAFAARLDPDVLATLGALEVPGPFFGSVSNYNRLALLPETVRRHRLQALAEFPALVAPLLLDVYGRPDMFGTDEDEPQQSAECDHGAGATVLDAMDRGRDLVGALAAHYGISRALVRSPMMREPCARLHAPRRAAVAGRDASTRPAPIPCRSRRSPAAAACVAAANSQRCRSGVSGGRIRARLEQDVAIPRWPRAGSGFATPA